MAFPAQLLDVSVHRVRGPPFGGRAARQGRLAAEDGTAPGRRPNNGDAAGTVGRCHGDAGRPGTRTPDARDRAMAVPGVRPVMMLLPAVRRLGSALSTHRMDRPGERPHGSCPTPHRANGRSGAESADMADRSPLPASPLEVRRQLWRRCGGRKARPGGRGAVRGHDSTCPPPRVARPAQHAQRLADERPAEGEGAGVVRVSGPANTGVWTAAACSRARRANLLISSGRCGVRITLSASRFTRRCGSTERRPTAT